MALKGRDIIVYLAVKYEGDWNKIYDAIKRKELVDEQLVLDTVSKIKSKYTTIVDQDYPESLKKIYKPPFVLFYNGNLYILNNRFNLGIFCGVKPTKYTIDMTKSVVNNDRMTLILHQESDISTSFSVFESRDKRIFVSSTGKLYEPKSNSELFITEYPESSAANKEHINWTSRVIAGLSQALLIPQAKAKNDTAMILAGYAAYLDKPIGVIAQKHTDSEGTNKLVVDGIASIVTSSDNIFALVQTVNKDESLLKGNPVA
jgi:DNA processing protein